jgi:hypothetical protein
MCRSVLSHFTDSSFDRWPVAANLRAGEKKAAPKTRRTPSDGTVCTSAFHRDEPRLHSNGPGFSFALPFARVYAGSIPATTSDRSASDPATELGSSPNRETFMTNTPPNPNRKSKRKRRITFAVLFSLMAGFAVCIGVWCLLSAPRAKATVRLRVPNPGIGVAAGAGESVEIRQKAHIALAKSRLVLNDAARRLDPALFARVHRPVNVHEEPVEWLEKRLKIEFVGPTLMTMTVEGDARDEAILGVIIEAVGEAYTDEILNKTMRAAPQVGAAPLVDQKAIQAAQAAQAIAQLHAAIVHRQATQVQVMRAPPLMVFGPLGW